MRIPVHRIKLATSGMTHDTVLPFLFPAVQRKKVTAAFDGGRITSHGGVMLLAAAERRLGLGDRLAAVMGDRRHPDRVTHAMADILRARIFAIACGYEDANDLDRLRSDPAFKLACGRLPDNGMDLCSQPTLSRMENLPDLGTVIRLGHVLVDLWLSSCRTPPDSVALEIDDTLDVVHGHQQLSLFNAHGACPRACLDDLSDNGPAHGALVAPPSRPPTLNAFHKFNSRRGAKDASIPHATLAGHQRSRPS